ncbi:type II secretion system major pseudopilin GspG [Loktanella sp. IMCC34160]|uniref:type II secretion system major pseudopilin GspG n=1 Tax=Loktanella sp. IMCC34160 TaxID=2510646 RepID=UPI002414236A|nr:type II secretion system major pseudopilin GspG [Loktanella sp. IMCC34160]
MACEGTKLNLPLFHPHPRSGVTLLEVLVVLAIIAMIAALAAPRLLDSFGRAKSQAAEVQLSTLKGAVQLYYLDTGQLPSQGEGLGALATAPGGVSGWKGPYADAAQLLDPWGRPWTYRQPGEGAPFTLGTLGRDGQPGGSGEDADITL